MRLTYVKGAQLSTWHTQSTVHMLAMELVFTGVLLDRGKDGTQSEKAAVRESPRGCSEQHNEQLSKTPGVEGFFLRTEREVDSH